MYFDQYGYNKKFNDQWKHGNMLRQLEPKALQMEEYRLQVKNQRE